ncbi:MAG: SDR family oxidoreductase [Candidatus Puniceispirillales bacterium]|jgi:3-oxoacyl-[acyl-carrier protein] reductase
MNNEMPKVAIVTGAAKNIGRATCESLSKLGYNILVHANTDKDGAEETVNLVKQNDVQSARIIGDLTRPETSQELIKEASKLGTISALVNNASQREFNKFDDMTFDEWRFVMSINLDSLFHTCKAVIPEMKKNKWGRIVNLGGLSAHISAIGRAHVITSKSAVVGFTRALAMEYAETGITINTVVPGLIDTIRGASAGSSLVHPSHSNPPVGRKGYPIEVATMITNLCGPHSDFVTGQTIHVNGGSYYP